MTVRWLAVWALIGLASTHVRGDFLVRHRLNLPEDAPWTSRGRLIPSDAENFTLLPGTDSPDLVLPSGLDPALVRYEVSVIREAQNGGHGPQASLHRAVSVDRPLCSLNPPTYGPAVLSDTILLHVRKGAGDELDLVGTGWDQLKSCSPEGTVYLEGVSKALQRVGRWKTKVSVRHSEQVDLPELPPSPGSLAQAYLPDGTPKPPPPPEKGFLTKWAPFILPILVLLLLSSGPEDKKPAEPARR